MKNQPRPKDKLTPTQVFERIIARVTDPLYEWRREQEMLSKAKAKKKATH